MLIYHVDYSGLPEGKEAAFVAFINQLAEKFSADVQADLVRNTDQSYQSYRGKYEPQRAFATAVLAFLDEYEIDSAIVDPTLSADHAFASAFAEMERNIRYLMTRFSIRTVRPPSLESASSVLLIPIAYKDQISECLREIRRIVDNNVASYDKRDKIFRRINALQSEVDRDKTTTDVLFGRAVQLSATIKEVSENIEAALPAWEKVKKLLWDTPVAPAQLPKPEEQKLLTHDTEEVN